VSSYRFTPEAENDLFEIWLYIAADSMQAADRVEANIHRACTILSESPLHGHIRKDLTDLPLRFWTLPRYRNYLIVYDPRTRPLQIIRIVNGARNMPVLFESAPHPS
jgi:plasmid stabilization system protein ParE